MFFKHRSLISSTTFFFAVAVTTLGHTVPASATPPHFEKLVLTREYYCDGVATGDINKDGNVDVVAGPFWYAGPEFKTKHEFYPAVVLPTEPSPSNSMFSFVRDFSGDQWPDIMVLGRVHKHAAYWYENPGQAGGAWKRHFAFERVRGESPTMVDLDGDGKPQVICHWDGKWGWIEPHPAEPRRPWRFVPIGKDMQWPQFYHGTGVGDVNGDKRLDVVINDGWYEQPAKANRLWTFHSHTFSRDRGGAQMFVYDVDRDGRNDIISSINAHGWGLAWYQQNTSDDGVAFAENKIMGDRSEVEKYGAAFTQPHALEVADIDGDGDTDIITGKRRWAHGPKGDIEPAAPPVVFWFELQRDQAGNVKYVPHQIDNQSGIGVQIAVDDVNGDGRVDVLTTSKLGTFVFLNRK